MTITYVLVEKLEKNNYQLHTLIWRLKYKQSNKQHLILFDPLEIVHAFLLSADYFQNQHPFILKILGHNKILTSAKGQNSYNITIPIYIWSISMHRQNFVTFHPLVLKMLRGNEILTSQGP